MLSNAKALEYIVRVTLGKHSGTLRQDCTLNGRPAIEILPKNVRHKRTVLCVHGMSVHGYHDQRMIGIGHALAAMGYTAVIPAYREIQDLVIDPTSSDRIADDIAALSDASGYPIGIFTASFSGGLSLIAAAKPSVADRVAAMLVVGSYVHVDSTLDFFLHREKFDPYGLFIVLKNFLPYINEPEALVRAFTIAAQDDGFQRERAELEPFLQSQSPEIARRFRRYLEDAPFRLEQWQRINKIPEALHIFQSMDVMQVADGLRAALCLLHGAQDIVIPPEESLLLERTVRGRLPVSLTVSSIIDHGNVRVGLSMAKELLALVRTFALFFRSLDGASAIKE